MAPLSQLRTNVVKSRDGLSSQIPSSCSSMTRNFLSFSVLITAETFIVKGHQNVMDTDVPHFKNDDYLEEKRKKQ